MTSKLEHIFIYRLHVNKYIYLNVDMTSKLDHIF